MIYFKEKGFFPASRAESEQLAAVMRFRETFPSEGLYWTFKTDRDFERIVRRHLAQFVQQQAMRIDGHEASETVGRPTPTSLPSTAGSARSAREEAETLLTDGPSLPVSTLALRALLLARRLNHAAQDWLAQEVVGYPYGPVEDSEPVFPEYRKLTVHASQVMPESLGLWASLDQAITARPNHFITQFLWEPSPLSKVEARQSKSHGRFYVLWMKAEDGKATGKPAATRHDADYVVYIQPHEYEMLLQGVRQRVTEFLLEAI